MLDFRDIGASKFSVSHRTSLEQRVDAYFSIDVETDGPIPGPYSMLSFAVVFAGTFDGTRFEAPNDFSDVFYAEIKPISNAFQPEALNINRIDRDRLVSEGLEPRAAMNGAYKWIKKKSRGLSPVMVAYPLVFDWTWIYWYFTSFCDDGSPFNHSRGYDLKTALAVKNRQTVTSAGRKSLPAVLSPNRAHTHHAIDDALVQAEIFANIFDWNRHDETD